MDKISERKEGHYWCKFDGEWNPCRWTIWNRGDGTSESWWDLCGSDHSFYDKDFEEIDETILTYKK